MEAADFCLWFTGRCKWNDVDGIKAVPEWTLRQIVKWTLLCLVFSHFCFLSPLPPTPWGFPLLCCAAMKHTQVAGTILSQPSILTPHLLLKLCLFRARIPTSC
jgi:hypothetical protein